MSIILIPYGRSFLNTQILDKLDCWGHSFFVTKIKKGASDCVKNPFTPAVDNKIHLMSISLL